MNPAGRVRIRDIMPIARDYSRASQSFLFASFLFARLTRAEHDFHAPGRLCSAGQWEGINEDSVRSRIVNDRRGRDRRYSHSRTPRSSIQGEGAHDL